MVRTARRGASAIWTPPRGSSPTRAAVRDQERKDDVHAKVAATAKPRSACRSIGYRAVWEELMEQSIAHETERWDEARGQPTD